MLLINETSTTGIYTLSLHDALPILNSLPSRKCVGTARSSPMTTRADACSASPSAAILAEDRKSTRLNSSHVETSYAVFCLKKKTRVYTYLWSISYTRRHTLRR